MAIMKNVCGVESMCQMEEKFILCCCIILWILATLKNISYFPMVICFVMFLANDIYGYYNWIRMRKRQEMQ